MTRKEWDLSTVAARSWYGSGMINEPAAQPIYQSAAWQFESLDEAEAIFAGNAAGTAYGTDGVPTVVALEAALASLEGGEAAVATNGGLTAFAATFLALLKPGDRVVCYEDAFGGTIALLDAFEGWGIQTSYIDPSQPEALARELAKGARMVIAETIANPTMRVADLQALAAVAHDNNALFIVDNTLATPLHCRPLAHGADLVIESTTKSLSGHFDTVGGAVVGSVDLIERIRRFSRRAGFPPAPFAAWLVNRGLPSFPLRQARAAASATEVARALAGHPRVRRVLYPGLVSSPEEQAVVSRNLSNGHGAMLAFELSGDRAAINEWLRALKLVRLVHSLGGTSSTLSHALTMTHRLVSSSLKEKMGLREGYFRFSTGLEDPRDLIDDLLQAFDR